MRQVPELQTPQFQIVEKNTFIHVVEPAIDEELDGGEKGCKLRRQNSAPASISDTSSQSLYEDSSENAYKDESAEAAQQLAGAPGESPDYWPTDTESEEESDCTQGVQERTEDGSAARPQDGGPGDAQGDASGARREFKRPCKGQRRRYRNLVAKIEESIRADPTKFSLEDMESGLPSSIFKDTRCRVKLMHRLEGALERALLSRGGGAQASASSSSAGCSGTPQAPSHAGGSSCAASGGVQPAVSARSRAAGGPPRPPMKMSL